MTTLGREVLRLSANFKPSGGHWRWPCSSSGKLLPLLVLVIKAEPSREGLSPHSQVSGKASNHVYLWQDRWSWRARQLFQHCLALQGHEGTSKMQEKGDDMRESRVRALRDVEYTTINAYRIQLRTSVWLSSSRRQRVKKLVPLKDKPWTNMSKYYRYHRSCGNRTDSCMQLKDAIEEIIQ